MTKMPDKIYAHGLTEKLDHGLWTLHGGRKHPQQLTPEQYTHTQQLIEKLEGQLGQYDICDDIAIGYDQAINEVIEMLRGEDDGNI